MRINQYVAAATGLSRRAADTAVASGRVMLGEHIARLGDTVPDQGSVQLDGRTLSLPTTHLYAILHKPAGYVSSRARQGDDPTLYALLPAHLHSLRIAGRLDCDSSGLILLSDDGPFIHRYTHPSFGKTKRYELELSQPLSTSNRKLLEAGVKLEDGVSHVTVLHAAGRHITLTLAEGRNRQLRRTFGALGYAVERLHRTHMGSYELGDLVPGAWKEVSAL